MSRSDLTRRQLLEFGASAGALSWLGCGGGGQPGRRRTATALPPGLPRDELRSALRDAVVELEERFVTASAWASVTRTVTAIADGSTVDVRQQSIARAVLTAKTGAGQIALELEDTSLSAVDSARDRLLSAPKTRAAPTRTRAPIDHDLAAGRLPDVQSQVAVAGATVTRARAALARIAYRAATFETEAEWTMFIGGDVDVSQTIHRASHAITLVARAGGELRVGTSAIGRGRSLAGLELPPAAIAMARAGALAVVSEEPIEVLAADVVLAPDVVLAVVRDCVMPRARGPRWQPDAAAPASSIEIVDDPTAAGSYHGRAFDDEGVPGSPTRVFGDPSAPLTTRATAAMLDRSASGHGRRDSFGRLVARPTSVVVRASGDVVPDLSAGVARGFVVDGDAACVIGDGIDVVRAPRAREVVAGRLTGKVFGPVVIQFDHAALRSALVGSVARTVHTRALSVTTPALRVRGTLRGGPARV